LVLLPSEAPAFVPLLAAAKVPIAETRIATSSAVSITGKIAAEVAADTELKEMAQKAMSSYVRSVLLQTNKNVFKASELPVNEYGESLGLAIVPKLKKMLSTAAARSSSTTSKDALADTLVLRAESNKLKNANKSLMRLKAKIAEEKAEKKKAKAEEEDDEEDDDEEEDEEEEDEDEKRGLAEEEEDDDEDEELLVRKHQQGQILDNDDSNLEIPNLSNLTDHERARVHRIMRDTVAIGAVGSKQAADKAAGRSTPFEKIVAEKRKSGGANDDSIALTKDSVLAAAAAHTAKVAARLAVTSARDKELEKVRVREMKRAAKKRNRDVIEEEEVEEEEEEEEEEEMEEEGVDNPSSELVDDAKKKSNKDSTESLEDIALRLMKKKKV